MQINRAEDRKQKTEVSNQKSEVGKSMSFRGVPKEQRGISFHLLKYKDEISRRFRQTNGGQVAPRNDKLFWFGMWILMFGISLSGCNSQQQKSYDKSTMITYAELTLLYEKEKMVNKETDSSYVIKVNQFFSSKGLEQDEFKKKIETISKDEEEWKIFIQDVSTAMDSLKRYDIAK